MGEYPGAIADDSAGYIYGSIFKIADTTELFKHLDDYEGFGEEQEQPNLFVREVIKIETDKGLIDCEVYLYNLAVDGLKMVESGNYREFEK